MLQEATSRAQGCHCLSGRVPETGFIAGAIGFGRACTEVACSYLSGVHKMLCRALSEFRVIHRFMALKASRDLKQWTDKGFLAEVDMRKGVLLPIHIEVALLDEDCCWPRSASCLII